MRSLPAALVSMLAFGGEGISPEALRVVTRGGRRGKLGHRGQYGLQKARRRDRNRVARAERRAQRRAARG